MKKSRPRGSTPRQDAAAHTDHLEAQEDHSRWLKEIERWRGEFQYALEKLARRLMPELEIDKFADALDRHEAAIYAHEELVDRHEKRLGRQRAGVDEPSEEVESLHQQMHDRHERSRCEHEELARAQRAILEAMASYEEKSRS